MISPSSGTAFDMKSVDVSDSWDAKEMMLEKARNVSKQPFTGYKCVAYDFEFFETMETGKFLFASSGMTLNLE